MQRLFGTKGAGATAAGIVVALSSWRWLSSERKQTIPEADSNQFMQPLSIENITKCSPSADHGTKASSRSFRDHGILPSVSSNIPPSSGQEGTSEYARAFRNRKPGSLHPRGSTHAKIARCRRLLRRKMVERGIPGAVVAVMKDGNLIWSEGMGYADVENDVPCKPNTLMRIASISKPLTAVALFQLWQKGLVDLDAPIQKYVPEFPEKEYKGEKVTISLRQLLSHTAGIRHYSKTKEEDKKEFDKTEYFISTHYDSVLDSLKLFSEDKLLSKPGEEYYYTTHGWTLISAAIEKVSNQKFLQYMSDHVFKPLGMSSTHGEFHTPLVYNRARHYHRCKDGLLQNTPYVDLSYKWAGGGFISTAKDLTRFGNALLTCYQLNSSSHDEVMIANESSTEQRPIPCSEEQRQHPIGQKCILESDTIAMMWKPVVSPNKSKPELSYGMGWAVREGDEGTVGGKARPFYAAHSGGAVGASSILVIMPSNNSAPIKRNAASFLQLTETGFACAAENEGDRECGQLEMVGVPSGVVVAVLFNLQEVKNVTAIGVEIAEQFL